jgi:hypothetical protein
MSRANSDEHYIIDLCDKILERKASRGHRFRFLLGYPSLKTGKQSKLPVDGYYDELKLVIEYREWQHEEHRKVDKRITAADIPRYQQRSDYDQLRRDILPQYNIRLIEIDYIAFNVKNKKLVRDKEHDEKILRTKLIDFL